MAENQVTEPADPQPTQPNLAGFARRATILVAALILAASVAASFAWRVNGMAGLLAVLVAGSACLVCGVLALIAHEFLQKPQLVMYQVLATMALRMGIPLGLCLIFHVQRGSLAEAGIVYYLLAFYLVTLVVETLLAVVTRASQPGMPSRSAKAV